MDKSKALWAMKLEGKDYLRYEGKEKQESEPRSRPRQDVLWSCLAGT